MFETLESIPWDQLKQAHGGAHHVPEALRGLMSKSMDTCNTSYWKLDNHVVVQSDLYESAFYVVPFLLEILNSPECVRRDLVYNLLYEIGNGYAPTTILCQDDTGSFLSLQEACRERVAGGIEIYLKEVEELNSEARTNALELLASLKEYGKIFLPRLEILFLREVNNQFKQELKETIRLVREPE